ncbi:NAD(P)H-hydrate dehydratase [Lutimaribacter sp. EGI FJ00015]|uniref:NAD(P)H-hydrate dehydratase n=1 Tax=Lutimaribacter degradans TaxID=2945989 RepID=A0ACC5ZUD6_9RHOB|nr:NAD(P)H-hydrate dehydratase [Lutimaribacter sp. EGI FJ00013]MCM2560999.1 NAD(P)H-hydrate dehydratase [Lutimaribacter sp. EGI FJ00013]MCO0612054.1 NAD(P)H-hydrate dehydratase [Lutimaribacter sp. EGI FJ00015]MCO0634826.1 NAD(P)H-hydrate dehydratase [Lutimaribacter sp. EGI FJ00014]
MTELLSAAQMRAIERAAIDSDAVTGLELMERAGRGVVEAVFEAWPALAAASGHAVVLCGPGNNGGDGFVVARLLSDHGWQVTLFLYGDPEKLPPDARSNHARWQTLGTTAPWNVREIADAIGGRCDLVVDAVFGIGLSRAMAGQDAEGVRRSLARHCITNGKPAVAVDIPTGIEAETGRDLGGAFPALLTVTFHKPKIGHYLADGPQTCGALVVCDIGLAAGVVEPAPTLVQGPRGRLGKADHGHKYTSGHALILSGGAGRTGAARLAARGALRIGAGLVTLGVPGAAQMEVASQVTAVMLRRIEDAAGLDRMLNDRRLNALCLGPGLGLSDEKAALTGAALASARPCVLDADALTLVAKHAPLFALLHETCVLTPHAGEFARLFPDLAERLTAQGEKGTVFSRLDAARAAARRAGCVVVLKGPDTVIAAPDGACSVNAACYDRAAPWLATAGSGDVLAGFITGLLARGLPPMEAAETAAWLHVETARVFGPGLIAEDLPEQLPKVFRALGL